MPFCLVGGRARVEGVGERVTPLPFEARDYLLLLPPFGVDTARVYRAWDDDPRDEGPNALTAAALAVEPRLARWRDALGGAGRAPSRRWPAAARPGSSRGDRWGRRRPRGVSCASGPRRPGWCAPARVPAGWEGED